MVDAETVEKFRRVVMDLELPREESVLFGVVCSYCGKGDRIRELEPPERLKGQMEEMDLALYRGLWELLAGVGESGEGLAACGFCRNIMTLRRRGEIQPLL